MTSIFFSPDAAGAFRLGQPVDPELALLFTTQTFDLWGLIYVGMLVYAIFQARAQQHHSALASY